LKDKKNCELRENVLCGTISPEKIATMTSEEMASEEASRDNCFYELSTSNLFLRRNLGHLITNSDFG